jgi:hypothetical protein
MTTATEKQERTIAQELEIVRRKGRGILRAESVVEYARDPGTALHERFEWDDDKAAQEYRIWQARHLIRVMVTVLPQHKGEVRVYVSLGDDRQQEGGGYRTISAVMADPEMRTAMLEEAADDMRLFKVKYRVLTELADVFEAMDRAMQRDAAK